MTSAFRASSTQPVCRDGRKGTHFRPGLTLVEVLAATVLLALLAAAVVPLIREVGRAVRESPPEAAIEKLGRLGEIADRVLADPKRYGLENIDRPETMGATELRYPKNESGPAVMVSRLASPTAGRFWLVFRAEGAELFRCVAASPSSSAPSRPSRPPVPGAKS